MHHDIQEKKGMWKPPWPCIIFYVRSNSISTGFSFSFSVNKMNLDLNAIQRDV